MQTARTIGELRQALAPLRARGAVGLVPTMGALHEGHRALLRAARSRCETVVASVFVNPTQFGADEDFERYPRDFSADEAILAEEGVDFVFAPSPDEIYPPGYQTWVDVEELGRVLEGAARPGHFRGVATVCLKLFLAARPDVAFFGQKDAQQVAVVERLVRDLSLELEIAVVPTVRDTDRLALSSRNAYLSTDEREAAASLPRALEAGATAFRGGGDPQRAARAVLAAEPRLEPDYVEVAEFGSRRVLAAAARVGSTRLIDNVILEELEPR